MKTAFDGEVGGYRFKASYLDDIPGKALIEISRGGEVVKSFRFPAYKVWNIAAHAQDIADGLDAESDEGLLLAGSDGLGGNAYPR